MKDTKTHYKLFQKGCGCRPSLYSLYSLLTVLTVPSNSFPSQYPNKVISNILPFLSHMFLHSASFHNGHHARSCSKNVLSSSENAEHFLCWEYISFGAMVKFKAGGASKSHNCASIVFSRSMMVAVVGDTAWGAVSLLRALSAIAMVWFRRSTAHA